MCICAPARCQLVRPAVLSDTPTHTHPSPMHARAQAYTHKTTHTHAAPAFRTACWPASATPARQNMRAGSHLGDAVAQLSVRGLAAARVDDLHHLHAHKIQHTAHVRNAGLGALLVPPASHPAQHASNARPGGGVLAAVAEAPGGAVRTIWRRFSSWLRRNLRVRTVMGLSDMVTRERAAAMYGGAAALATSGGSATSQSNHRASQARGRSRREVVLNFNAATLVSLPFAAPHARTLLQQR